MNSLTKGDKIYYKTFEFYAVYNGCQQIKRFHKKGRQLRQ